MLAATALVVAVVGVAGPTVAATLGDAVGVELFQSSDADIYEDGDVVIAEDHVAAVTEAGSVNATLELERDEGSRTVGVTRTTRIDFENRTLLTDNVVTVSLYGGFVSSEPLRVRQYETPEGTYTRTTSSLVDGNYTRYDPPNGTWAGDDVETQSYAPVLEDAENLSWTRQGRETHDGVEVVRYTVEDVADVEGVTFELAVNASDRAAGGSRSIRLSLGNLTVEDVEGTLLVDTDGVVRHLSYDVEVVEDGESVTYTADLSFSGVDDTDVSRPRWTADADDGT